MPKIFQCLIQRKEKFWHAILIGSIWIFLILLIFFSNKTEKKNIRLVIVLHMPMPVPGTTGKKIDPIKWKCALNKQNKLSEMQKGLHLCTENKTILFLRHNHEFRHCKKKKQIDSTFLCDFRFYSICESCLCLPLLRIVGVYKKQCVAYLYLL